MWKTARIWIPLLLALGALLSPVAARRPEPWPTWTPEARLRLGVCLAAETDLVASQDWPGIGHALVKHWRVKRHTQGWNISEMIRRYCNVFRGRSDRARRIRNSTWEDPLHRQPRHWRPLRKWVWDFSRQMIDDPTPMATDWNCGECFAEPQKWEVIAAPPLTANVFVRPR
jgi:hypothetical protein